ncbi:MAG: peptidase, partial [Methanoregula sp.]|nr:peptidase [Methanoregula sp.]
MTPDTASTPIRTVYRPGEIAALCDTAIATATAALDRIAALKKEARNTDSTLLAFEAAIADYSDAILPVTLMGYV